MKKLNLALVLAGALTGAAQAQSAIEVYGIADMGLVQEVGNVAGSGATAAGNKSLAALNRVPASASKVRKIWAMA